MDCDNARLFLPFLRPGGKDLDGAEEAELRAHLEQCSSCNAQAMNANKVDQHLGRAMRAVEVPVGMKARLLERLAEDRGVIRRKRLRRAGIAAGLAAAVLLAIGGWLYKEQKTPIDPTNVAIAVSMGQTSGQTSETDSAGSVPSFVNTANAFPVGEPTLAELPGHRRFFGPKVPRFVFVRTPPQQTRNNEPEVAIVYAIKKKTGYVVGVPGTNDPSYRYQAFVHKDNSEDTQYIILYNGRDSNWLFGPDK
jgi:hypothetical protein